MTLIESTARGRGASTANKVTAGSCGRLGGGRILEEKDE